jgi:hypothetical protein
VKNFELGGIEPFGIDLQADQSHDKDLFLAPNDDWKSVGTEVAVAELLVVFGIGKVMAILRICGEVVPSRRINKPTFKT